MPSLWVLLPPMAAAAAVFLATRALSGALPGRRAPLLRQQMQKSRPQVRPARQPSAHLARLGGWLARGGYRAWLIRRIVLAGGAPGATSAPSAPSALKAELARKAAYALAGAALSLLVAFRYPAFALTVLPVALTAGFFIPDYLLLRQAKQQAAEIQRNLPDALDLLVLCLASGLPLEAAMSRVSQATSGAVSNAFGRLVRQIQLGSSRAEAFASLQNDTPSPALRQFLGAVLQVDRLGVPIGAALAAQATELRAIRKDTAREQGQQLTVKVLFPLMLCFLPAMFLIVIGPAVVQLIKTLTLL